MNPHFTEAWRAVALGRIDAFVNEAERLGELAHAGTVDRAEAGNCLQSIATAHGFSDTFGDAFIIDVIADAFVTPAEAAELRGNRPMRFGTS